MDEVLGLVLDSSAVIQAERLHMNARQMISDVGRIAGNVELALSAVGWAELLQGLYRESDSVRRTRRVAFFQALHRDMAIYPFTVEIAALAGRLGGEAAGLGFHIPFADLLIGATALHLNFAILTANERHFRMIPNLQVLTF